MPVSATSRAIFAAMTPSRDSVVGSLASAAARRSVLTQLRRSAQVPVPRIPSVRAGSSAVRRCSHVAELLR